jgi:hypothetical protein
MEYVVLYTYSKRQIAHIQYLVSSKNLSVNFAEECRV